jgi:ketosteroid isomerase-like protein
MKLTKKIEAEILKVYEEYWRSYLAGDLRTLSGFLTDDFKLIGTTESEVFHNKKTAMKYLKATIHQIAGVLTRKNSSIKLAVIGESIVVDEQFDGYVNVKGQPSFYSVLRVSSIFKCIRGKWLIAHQHGSLPDPNAEAGETLAAEKLEKENRELKEAVHRHTKDLEDKNRELEIEASLERVRARAMAMQSSTELADLIGLIHGEIARLDKNLDRSFIMLFDERGGSTWWMSDNKNLSLKRGYYIAHHKHAPYQAVLRGWRQHKTRWTYLLKGAVKKKWDDFIFNETELAQLPKMIKSHMAGAKVAYWSSSFNKYGCISTGSVAPLENSSFDLMVRFSRMFEQTYTRFLDLQKSEAQTREAEVELSLERVRARAMAMQSSNELGDLIGLIYTELARLDKSLNVCLIKLFEKSGDSTWWMASREMTSLKRGYIVPHSSHRIHLAYLAAWKRRDVTWRYLLKGTEKKKWDDYIFNKTEIGALPKGIISNMRARKVVHIAASFNRYGCMQTGAMELLPPGSMRLLERFSAMFEQTYMRFLDLKNAEAQTRESQIQLALERVRARTMAMQRSDELQDAANLLFRQVRELKIPVWSCGFNIWEKGEKECIGWMSTNDAIQPPFRIPLNESPTFIRFYKSRQENEDFFVEKVEGKALAAHYKYMLKLPDFAKIIKERVKTGFSFPNHK